MPRTARGGAAFIGVLVLPIGLCFALAPLWLFSMVIPQAPLLGLVFFGSFLLIPVALGGLISTIALSLLVGTTSIECSRQRLIRRDMLGPLCWSKSSRPMAAMAQFTIHHGSKYGVLLAECPPKKGWRVAGLYPTTVLEELGLILSGKCRREEGVDRGPRVERLSNRIDCFYERPHQPLLSSAEWEETEDAFTLELCDSTWSRRIILRDDGLFIYSGDELIHSWTLDVIDNIRVSGEYDEDHFIWSLTVVCDDRVVQICKGRKDELEWVATILRRQLGIPSQLPSATLA